MRAASVGLPEAILPLVPVLPEGHACLVLLAG
jgi:hypothetical protein